MGNTIFFKTLVILSITFFCRPTTSDAQSTDLLIEESQSLYDNTNYHEAFLEINKSLKLDSSNLEALILKARIQLKLNQNKEVVKTCYKILKLSPNNPEAYILRGDLAMVSFSYGTAIQFYTKAYNHSSKKSVIYEVHLKTGLAEMQRNQNEDAHYEFMKAYELSSQDTALLYPFSRNLMLLGKISESLFLANKIVTEYPNDPNAFFLLGEIYQSHGETIESIENFQIAIELNKGFYNAHLSLCNSYLSMHNYTEALKSSNQAVALSPNTPMAYNLRGIVYLEKKELGKACDNLFKALQLGYLNSYGDDILDIYINSCEN